MKNLGFYFGAAILATLFGTTAFGAASATEIKITAFYKLDAQNRQDRAADVCFSVSPAPSAPQFVQITADKGYNTEGIYSAFIGPKGKACAVIATFAGTVEVEIASAISERTSAKDAKSL